MMSSPVDPDLGDEAPAPYYRQALALVHDRGYAFHAAACAPGIIDLLAPVLVREGLVLELGCGSGLLTKDLIAAGHRVIATDASPAMLDLAAEAVGDRAVEVRQLTLPDDPLPPVDAIVATGHPLNYLPDAEAIGRSLSAMADALQPGGILAFDLCDLSWGQERRDASNLGRCGEGWAIITRFSVPAPDRFVRDITVFVPDGNGRWRRDEHHENVLVDTDTVPPLLARRGVRAHVAASFGAETLPPGLHAVVGERPA